MKRDFTLIDGGTVPVDMMQQEEDFKYVEGEGFAAARFPYGREKVAMYIFLPDAGASIDSFLAGLTQEELDTAIDEMKLEPDLDVRIPKFKVEYGVKRLNDALTALGMGIAFDRSNADFSDIAEVAPQNLFIAFVDHKALIEVDEKGTEAAAATVVSMGLTSMPSPSKNFHVDRPFFFIIRDDRTNTILFMGKITNPLKEK
jgi:serpin B